MQVHLFRGRDRIFAITPDVAGTNLPNRFGAWTPVKSVDMIRGQTMPGVVVEDCLDDIETYGVHITDAHVRITEQALS